MQIHYSLPEYEDKHTSTIVVPWISDIHDAKILQEIAVMCAEEFSKSILAISATWPLLVALHITQNGPEIARFSVGKRIEEMFYAQEGWHKRAGIQNPPEE